MIAILLISASRQYKKEAKRHQRNQNLVVGGDPGIKGTWPVRNLRLGEPVLDLMLRRLGPIRAVDQVPAHGDTVVETDGPGGRGVGVGGAKDGTACLDGVLTFPDHGHNRAGGEVAHEPAEEGLLAQVFVVGLGLLLGGPDHLEANELVALVLCFCLNEKEN